MSTIRITIDTDNAAFHADPQATGRPDLLATGAEVARILRRMANEFECDGPVSNPLDINGKQVGTVEITDEETDR